MGRRLVVAQVARRGPYHDCATLRPLLDAASQRVPVGLVLADAAFDNERHPQYIRHHIGAHRVIPAKPGRTGWQISGLRAEMRQQVPSALDRPRALAKRVFSSVTRKLSTRAPGRP
jgi:hypothetical protein